MFNQDFYPTPPGVIAQMIPHEIWGCKILDPSAGKGDILDAINARRKTVRLFAIEKEPELQAILQSKGHKLIDTDFLNYQPEHRFDWIIMNPPFSNGEKHLLKAIEIRNGAGIVCLLNSQTISNPHTSYRRLLLTELDRAGAEIEVLGPVFRDAERTTDVSVTMIKIPRQKVESQFSFTGYGTERLRKVEEISSNQVAPADLFTSLITRYDALKRIGHQIASLVSEANFYSDGLLGNAAQVYLYKALSNNSPDQFHEEFVSMVRESAWRNLFSQTKLSGIVTSKVRDQLQDALDKQQSLAFTIDNIEAMISTLLFSTEKIQQDCIQQAFDIMTKYHSENRVYIEGWKTNDAWQVKQKVILPGFCSAGMFGDCPQIPFGSRGALDDIEKALCFVSGKRFNEISPISEMKSLRFGEWLDSEFFEIKLFKKGTLHIQFKDKDLLRRFNVAACQGRNWLPSEEGRSYQK